MMPKITIANRVHPAVLAYLGAHGDLSVNRDPEPWSETELLERSRDADAILAFMTDRIDEDFLNRCPKLRVVACALKGYDNFDVEACTRRGVWVTVVEDLLTAPTAELALGLMIALARNILPGDRHVRSGAFAGWRPMLYGRSLDGSVVGLLGAGAVGRAIAHRLRGFDVQLLYHDIRPVPRAESRKLRLGRVAFDTLLARSDFLVVAPPLRRDTLHLVNTATLRRLKPGAYLVNISRGSVVDEAAVATALQEGLLAGYAADVFEMEDWALPGRKAGISPVLLGDRERTVLTPHLGSAVADVRRQIELAAARSIVQVLRGERPEGAVNEPLSC